MGEKGADKDHLGCEPARISLQGAQEDCRHERVHFSLFLVLKEPF